MSSTKNCQICLKVEHKYCCPRCNILYCSVNCYKSGEHMQCSEAFYKDCILQEMAMQQHNKQKKSSTLADIPGISNDIRRMYEILKRMESCESNRSGISDFDISSIDSDDDADEMPHNNLTERLDGINLNDANAIWNKLTNAERKEFEELLENEEDIAKILPTFNPWWMCKKTRKLVEELKPNNDNTNNSDVPPNDNTDDDLINKKPEILSNIPEFSKIATKSPADCILHNIENVIAAYTITIRFFNGDYYTNIHESVNYLIAVCSTLKMNKNFDNQLLAIESVAYDCRNEGLTIDTADVDQMKIDVIAIMDGYDNDNTYILCLLSDIHKMLTLAKIQKPTTKFPITGVKDDNDGKENNLNEKCKKINGEFSKRFLDHQLINFDNIEKTKLNSCIKKIEYYLSYIKEFR